MPTPKRYSDPAARQRAYRERQAQARLQERCQKGLPATPPLATMPGERRWQTLLEQAQSALSCVQTEMQAYYEDRSEPWQEGERGEALLERLDGVESLLCDLENLQQQIPRKSR
jgi:hypothetical protein